ncbi:hypothetical protein BS50DRAFT_573179 [Corynespora cassiicola Philippines]|uniref:Rhodopsin domain-containing protein n=1 Tax=Corynespora cassiicola Philippines TaxID=1448308 RepID=A0A2T2NS29_CORCC|nr:hypothetical protein BS50DRAFT_573179 [Corynespora cassiicola Philippines]
MADSFTTEAFTLLAVGISVVVIRTTARALAVGFRGFHFDDYLMPCATVVYALETATAYAVGAWWFGLANNGMTEDQRRTLDPASKEYQFRVGGSKTQLVGWSLYTLLLWMLKLCMCHFYSRLTSGIRHLQLRVKCGYAIIIATYIATELSILFGCRPFHKNWQIYPDPGNVCQPAISKIDLYVTVILNVLTDIYLLSIPLPMLWSINVDIKTRISLLCVFGGGIFVIMAGILRCALILKDPINGAQAAGSWACRETFVAVIVGNAPMIYPLMRRGVQKVCSSVGLSRNGYSSGNPNSIPLKTRFSKQGGRGKLRSVNALPTTVNGGENEGSFEGWDSNVGIVTTVTSGGLARSERDAESLGIVTTVTVEGDTRSEREAAHQV